MPLTKEQTEEVDRVEDAKRAAQRESALHICGRCRGRVRVPVVARAALPADGSPPERKRGDRVEVESLRTCEHCGARVIPTSVAASSASSPTAEPPERKRGEAVAVA